MDYKYTGLKAVFILLLLSGCASAPELPPLVSCHFPSSLSEAPVWVCGEAVEGLKLSAVGQGIKTPAGPAVMRQRAAIEARAKLADGTRLHLQTMLKQFMASQAAVDTALANEVVASVSKLITDETITGARIYKSRTAPDGVLYVLVGLDETSVKQIAEHVIKRSMDSDAELWKPLQGVLSAHALAKKIADHVVR